MACPNKSSVQWKKLIEDLTRRFKLEGKEYSDAEIDKLAHLAFIRYGDIPPIEKAINYTSRTVNKEEATLDGWINYGKGQIINNQGDLSLDDFKKSFSERFGLDITDPNIDKIYEQAKLRYGAEKAAEGLFSNAVAEKQRQEGKPAYPGLIPRVRDFFTGNYNILGKESQESKDAAATYHGSEAQASAILRVAIANITKRFGGETWLELRKALVQSRLNGVKNRWRQMSEGVKLMSDEQLVDEINKGNYKDLLSQIEGRTPLDDLSKDVATLISNEDYDGVRTLISHAFDYASDNVAKLDFSGGRSYEEIKNDPKVKSALGVYKDLVEKPIAENHASNDGIFSDALGELDTYFPLMALDEKGRQFFSMKGSKKLNPTKNRSNEFATGLSNAYDVSVEKLSSDLTSAFKSNNKTAFINQLEKSGIAVMLAPMDKGRNVITINGKEYEAVTIPIGEPIIKDGRVIPAKKVLIPKWLEKELKPMLEDRDTDRTMFGKVMDKITAFALGGVVEPAMHTANLVGAIVNGTPFPGTSLASKTIGNTPLTKVFTGIFNIVTEDVTSDKAIKHIQEMANIGLLSGKTGKVTSSKLIAEQTGAKKVSFWDFSPVLYGRKGVDLKGRVLMDRICLEINPNSTPEQRRRFANQLGNYLKGMESQLERTVKRNGMAPFFTASSTFLKNGIKGWLGITPLPTEGMSFQRVATMRAAQLLSAGAIGLTGAWAATYYAFTKKYPWEDENSNFLKIPLTDDMKDYISERPLLKSHFYKDGKWQDINFGFFNKTLERGSRGLGIGAIYDTQMQGASLSQSAEAAEKDVLNSFLTPLVSSPGIHFATTAVTGHAPYIQSLRDYTTGAQGLEFVRDVRTMDNQFKQLGANAAEGFIKINPLLANVAENGFGMSFKPKYAVEEEDKPETTSEKIMGIADKVVLKTILDITFPNIFKNHIDNDKKAEQLKIQEKKTGKTAIKEETGVAPKSTRFKKSVGKSTFSGSGFGGSKLSGGGL